MNAAIVREAGRSPVYADFPEPVPENGEVKVSVRAAALSTLVRSRASGSHYSSSGRLPFVVGVDGVGRLDNGSRVYFVLPRAPYGSMSERTVVPQPRCVAVPDDLDDVTAAAIAIPGMSSWAALKERAHLRAGETVLINGATGAAGRLAVQIAKHLGARKVVATGRNVQTLSTLPPLGADVTIPIGDGGQPFEDELRQQFAGEGIDIVLDYLWGPTAERILVAGATGGRDAVPIRFVQIGAVAAPKITLPSAVLRSSAITLMGSGIGSVPGDRIVEAIRGVLQATTSAGFAIGSQVFPLSDIERVWALPEGPLRTVFRVG